MDVLFYCGAAAVVLILLVIFTFLRSKPQHDGAGDGDAVRPPARQAVAARAPQVGRVRRRVGEARNRMRDRQDDSDDDNEQEFEHVSLPSGKIGAKKMRKLQEKEEKARQREAELQEREERKQRQEQLDEERKKQEKREAAEEAAREAEEKVIKEEKERQEHEEYLKLKEQFTVDEEGTDACELHEDTESLLQKFVQYIKDMKVVMLEDLAVHFKLKTQDVIDRIKELQEADRLSGVLDDRGKFIYITTEEYEAVAKFIKQRGRVSITELAESSNKLINLAPDNQLTHTKLVTEISS